MQTRIISRVLRTTTAFRPPLVLRLFGRFPWLRRFPARLVGIGVRPEHVQSCHGRWGMGRLLPGK